MGPIERAKGLAGAIGLIIACFILLSCIPHLGESGFNMRACTLPAILQIAIPNFRLVIFLSLVFVAFAVWSWIDDSKF